MLHRKNIHNIYTIETIHNPQHFPISNTKILFFDIFYKNNKIYMIMPIYNTPALPEHIKLTVNNKVLHITESHVKDSNEPILIYIYEYITPPNSVIEVNVKLINNMTKTYALIHIYIQPQPQPQTGITNKRSNKLLALTTLFKDDYCLFPLFYNYYKEQGVDHFYMYYNGFIIPEIRKVFDKPDVTLVEWNFNYWNPRGVKYDHHAQIGQMHHALHKYGKDIYDYMIFCDLDEYLHIPKNKCIETIADIADLTPNSEEYIDNTIRRFIINNPDIDIFGFCNFWSNTMDDNIPSTPYLPNKFLSVLEPVRYLERSKNIYKVSSINTIGIHQVGYNFYSTMKHIIDLKMYHFYKWSSKSRVIENCTNIVEL
jgi:hypothetical protein